MLRVPLYLAPVRPTSSRIACLLMPEYPVTHTSISFISSDIPSLLLGGSKVTSESSATSSLLSMHLSTHHSVTTLAPVPLLFASLARSCSRWLTITCVTPLDPKSAAC